MIKNLLDKLFGKKEIRREGREFGVLGDITFNETSYEIDNWSASGFAVSGYEGSLIRGDHIDVTFKLELDGGTIEFDCKAIIVRVEETRKILAGVFVEMDTDTRVTIANYFDS
ncbi:hypothetical protein A9Q97_05525 [Rhodospirillales bacterium 47_12_T64]|nr:hypothetical protein A9Q97_05525 [Rhodospirillales bacterium 47_12_T64]